MKFIGFKIACQLRKEFESWIWFMPLLLIYHHEFNHIFVEYCGLGKNFMSFFTNLD